MSISRKKNRIPSAMYARQNAPSRRAVDGTARYRRSTLLALETILLRRLCGGASRVFPPTALLLRAFLPPSATFA